MSEINIIGLTAILLWLKNLWFCILWFLTSCFYKQARGIVDSKKKEMMRFAFTLCVWTIMGSILKILWIVDTSQITVIYWLVWVFAIPLMESIEKILLSKLNKLWEQ